MIAGTLEIQLLANMARLVADMDKAKRTVSGTVDTMNKVLSTIGIGVSFAGIASMIKGVIDVGDKLNDLKKITGLTVNELGGLDKQAKLNGTNLDSVAKAVGIMSKNMYAGADAFKLLGIETKNADGTLRNANQVLLEVSDRFSRMQDGAQKSAIANQIFGKSGRELIPMLNEGRGALESAAESHRRYSGITQESAEASDIFNDNLTLLGARITAIKTSFVGELLPTLNSIGNAMLSTGQSTNQFSFAASVVVPILKGLAVAGFTVADTFRGMGREIGARAAQLEALTRLDFKGMAFIGKSLAEDNARSRAEYDKLIDTIMNGDKVVQKANVSQQKMLDLQIQMPAATDAATKSIEKQTKAYDIEIYKLKQYEDLHKKGRDLTSSVANEQERYNNTLEELESLKPYITVETYNRALEKAQKELKGAEVQTRATTDEVSQLWVQAGRNIQSTLANSIFNFFDDGLKGMLKNVISTVGRIASEFAALKIAQSVGLAGIFGVSGAAGAAGTSGGGIGTALNFASMGSSAMNLFKVGGGISQGVSSLFGIGATGTQAAAEAGASALWGASGASGAASMGASIASFAGPAIAIAAVDQITRMLVGDKTLGGTAGKVLNFVPILGPLINGLFGRGPMKQGMTVLKGDLGAEGFESGMLQTRFDAKGGAFRSNKTDFATVDAVTGRVSTDNGKLNAYADSLSTTATQIIGLINDTTRQVSSSLYDIGDNLGLSTQGLDEFSHTIKLVSAAGKGLTEEQVGNEIASISDEMVKSLLPSISEFTKRGETATQAITRLSQEFASLESAAMNLGASSKYANDLIKDMSIANRSALIELSGGMEALASKTTFFAENFLTDAEKLQPVITSLHEGLSELGLSASLTKDQFKGLVQSTGTSSEMRNALLDLAPAFIKVTSAVTATGEAITKVAEDTTAVMDLLLSTNSNTLSSINTHAGKLQGLGGQLSTAMQSIFPQSVASARADIMANISFDKNGNPRGIKNIDAVSQQSIDTLSNQTSDGFSTREDFLRSKAKNYGVLNTLESARKKSLDSSNEAAAITQRLDTLIVATSKGSNATNDLYKLLRNMTTDGQSLNTAAA